MDLTIAIDGRRLSYDTQGEGQPILLVHGFPLSGRLWQGVVAGLGGRYRCIVPDLRGHGASEATASATMADYADDLAALLDGLEERRPVVLVGMSMGGYVSFEFCRRYPARVRALVLTNTRAEADSAEAAQARRETAQRVQKQGSALVAEAMGAKLFGPGAPPALKDEWRRIMAATPAQGVAAALKAMASRDDSLETLAHLECPILIIAGGEDAITPPADAEKMHRAAPGSRLEVIPGAGHMTALEQPGAFLSALSSFLSDKVGS